MTSVTITVKFCAAHRLMEYEGKCRFLHGHNYTVEMTVVRRPGGNELDELGMVIDFGDLKALVKGWIDIQWDHNTILNSYDVGTCEAVERINAPKKVFRMPNNPTAENMAWYLYRELAPKVRELHAEIANVKVTETDGCCADYQPD